ncbi:MAG: three-Cys-motif partner protein TcmP [Thermodesulfobacteriota bacterium]
MTTENEFFKAKRPWSKIKDKVIGNYLVPYLNKVSKLGEKIVIGDAFAGPGIFDDGSEGSPLIICKIAEKQVPGKYLGIFVNRGEESHTKLGEVLKKYIDEKKAITILGKAQDLLEKLKGIVGNATLLIYLDPFGLKGCEFRLLEPYLGRDKRFSTEIIVNMSMPTLHRLSTPDAIREKRITTRTKKLNQTLTDILGGEYWKEIMWSDLPPVEKEKKIVEKYVSLLNQYLPFAGFCPVRERIGKSVKYYMIFASRHPDALLLMNDIMYKSYFKTMHEIQYKDTLFEGLFDWRDTGAKEDIETTMIEFIRKRPGVIRKDLWMEIVKTNFMKWDSSTFNEKIKKLIFEKPQKIKFISSTKRFNENSSLYIIPRNQKFLIKEPRATYDIKVYPKIYYKEYPPFTGPKERLVERVNDGSIITRFDKTPQPKNSSDVVCPHFLELKWAYGCPFDCSWCYLKGTFRFRPNGKEPVIKDFEKIELHTRAFLEERNTPEILNSGEIADSLMNENSDKPFSRFIIPLFETQKLHKVLFLTKSSNVKNLLEIEPHHQAIISFSLNAIPVAKKWEKAPPIVKRIEAAKKVYQAGYEVRVRIDPMVPIDGWKESYKELVDLIFGNLVPERITLGSLRGLQSTINGCSDRSWVKYLTESSNWGKKIDFQTRFTMYSEVIKHLKSKYHYEKVALCKETIEMWDSLKMNYRQIKCNCVF